MLLKSHGLYEITKGEKEDPDGALGQCTIMFLEDEQEPAKEAELEAASEVEGEQRERDKEEWVRVLDLRVLRPSLLSLGVTSRVDSLAAKSQPWLLVFLETTNPRRCSLCLSNSAEVECGAVKGCHNF